MIELSIDFDYTYTTIKPLVVHKEPSVNSERVPHEELTADGQKHSNGSILNSNTRVTPLEFRIKRNFVWLLIPSGWICAIEGTEKYIK